MNAPQLLSQTAAPAPAERAALLTVRDDAGLRLWRIAGETGRLILCFSGIGADPDQAPPPEWQRLAALSPRDHLLFIADPARSWLNRPGLIEEIAAAIEAEATRIDAREICAVGHSLGGFSALVMPAFTRIDTAVALSPQYSVDPAIVPTEHRWANYREAISSFRIHAVADHLQANCQYFVFFGRHPREAVQRDLSKALPNLELYIMRKTNHNTAQRMKAAGVLDQVLTACFDRRHQALEDVMVSSLNGRRATVAT